MASLLSAGVGVETEDMPRSEPRRRPGPLMRAVLILLLAILVPYSLIAVGAILLSIMVF